MHTYNVHIYREMRLFFPGTTADTPEEAAQLAAEKPTSDAACIDACDGETLAALVDVIGDEEFEHSRMIRLDSVRDAAPEMPKALEMAVATGYAIMIDHAARQHAMDDIVRAESASSHLTQLEPRSLPMSDTPTITASPPFALGERVIHMAFTDCFGTQHPDSEIVEVESVKREECSSIPDYWRVKARGLGERAGNYLEGAARGFRSV